MDGGTSTNASRSAKADPLSIYPNSLDQDSPILPPPSTSGETRTPAVDARMRILPSDVDILYYFMVGSKKTTRFSAAWER